MTLAVLLALIVAGAWLLLPPLVGTLTQGALDAAGLQTDTITVTVVADPPPSLVSLRADAIRIQATNARFRGVSAAGLDVTLKDVHLLDQTFGQIDGTLTGLTMAATADRPALAIPDARISGSAARIEITMAIEAATAGALASAAIERSLGVAPGSIALVAPDLVRIGIGPGTVEARLSLGADGGLTLVPPSGLGVGPIPLVTPGPDVPFRITSFQIVNGGLALVATFDRALG